MHIVPEYVPPDGLNMPAISSRLRAFAFSIKIWEDKKSHAEAMLAEYERAREVFISRLPELPAWLTERGIIGCDCPDDAA